LKISGVKMEINEKEARLITYQGDVGIYPEDICEHVSCGCI
jgi:hypothetical protein